MNSCMGGVFSPFNSHLGYELNLPVHVMNRSILVIVAGLVFVVPYIHDTVLEVNDFRPKHFMPLLKP